MNTNTTKFGIGIMFLTPSLGLGDPPRDLSTLPCWTDPSVMGVAIRTQWARVEPEEGIYDWSYIDQAVSLGAAHGKKISILVTAGVTAPAWFFALPNAIQFNVTAESGHVLPMCVPFDHMFQTKWKAFLTQMAVKYAHNTNIAYIVMGGFGRRAESYFVTTQEDQTAMDALAVSMGFMDGNAAFLSGAKSVTQRYLRKFPGTHCICTLGAPYPTTQGIDTLKQLCDYGDVAFFGRFGVAADSLAPGQPTLNELAVTEIQALSGHTLVGYQATLPFNDTTKLQNALTRGIGFGAHYIEIYPSDFTPANASVFQAANASMLAK